MQTTTWEQQPRQKLPPRPMMLSHPCPTVLTVLTVLTRHHQQPRRGQALRWKERKPKQPDVRLLLITWSKTLNPPLQNWTSATTSSASFTTVRAKSL